MMAGIQRQRMNASSRNVRVTPEFRDKPDVEKLARALISIAKRSADSKAIENQLLESNSGKGDAMP